MKKQSILSIGLSILLIIFLSCTADTGPTGPDGPAGGTAYVMEFQYEVYPTAAYSSTIDTEIDEGNAGYNYGTCPTLDSGNYPTSRKSLYAFGISGYIPVNATIVSAYLTLRVTVGAGAPKYTAYEVTTDWTEGTDCGAIIAGAAAWNYPWTTTPGGVYSAEAKSTSVTLANATVEQYFSLKLNINMIENWISNPAQNNGVIIVEEGSPVGSGSMQASSEHAIAEYRPKLTVYYTVD